MTADHPEDDSSYVPDSSLSSGAAIQTQSDADDRCSRHGVIGNLACQKRIRCLTSNVP